MIASSKCNLASMPAFRVLYQQAAAHAHTWHAQVLPGFVIAISLLVQTQCAEYLEDEEVARWGEEGQSSMSLIFMMLGGYPGLQILFESLACLIYDDMAHRHNASPSRAADSIPHLCPPSEIRHHWLVQWELMLGPSCCQFVDDTLLDGYHDCAVEPSHCHVF